MADEKMTPDPVEQVREEMECTRASLSKKFDTLESKVAETVSKVTDTVGGTTASLSSAKESIEETVHTVKDAVRNTVSAVENFFDVRAQIHHHPWAVMCGSVMVGYLSERLLHTPWSMSAQPEAITAPRDTMLPSGKHNGHGGGHGGRHNGHKKAHAAKHGVLQSLAREFDSELGKIKNIALASLVTGLHQWLAPRIPEAVQPQVQDIVNSVAQKLGVDSGFRSETHPSQERFSESRRFAG